MKKIIYVAFLLTIGFSGYSQTNIFSTNPLAEQIMLGNYNPANYAASTIINMPNDIVAGIQNEISTDSLKAYLEVLSTFENRNTGADTVSQTRGIGATRRWIYQKFQDFSATSENRLVTSYLQFDRNICNIGQHRNIFTVLPGADAGANGIIILEAHVDSRCQGVCDTTCLAEGMEDNGSGTALVMELARVMSKYTFNHTIVFMATIGEEQGLYGADAFADYCVQKGINVKAVLNNDVIGGIICGKTSSPPSCPGYNDIDSTQVRIFSAGGTGSKHKALARFVKLEYQEMLRPLVNVPMLITIMSAEDRTGRGGDHIPFRQKGIAAIRFTSANEHGDASNGPNYDDRQHTHEDILGVDTDGDQVLDSFFVDFNYLARNARINGNAAAMAAIGPIAPINLTLSESDGKLLVNFDDPQNYGLYRVGVRFGGNNDFDTLITWTSTSDSIILDANGLYHISACSVDSLGIESLFSNEKFELVNSVATDEIVPEPEPTNQSIRLLQNRPNPFDEATTIAFLVEEPIQYSQAKIVITSMEGKIIQEIPTEIQLGMNELLYTHGYNAVGTYAYSLVVDGQVIASKYMVFAN